MFVVLASCASPKLYKRPNMQDVHIGTSQRDVLKKTGAPKGFSYIKSGPRKNTQVWIYEWDKKGDPIINQMFTYIYFSNSKVIAIEEDPQDKFERNPALRNQAIAISNQQKEYYRQLNSARFRAGAAAFAAGMAAAGQGMTAATAQQRSYTTSYYPSYRPTSYANQYDPNSLANPYGAGNPYKADGLMNPYSQYGSKYSNKSWRNPYATDAPKLYDSNGKYLGRFSSNPYDPDSISNPYGRYGSKYSSDSINNPYGAGNPYSTQTIYVAPQ